MGQSLVIGKDLLGITFSCNRNLHVEQRSKVSSSLGDQDVKQTYIASRFASL